MKALGKLVKHRYGRNFEKLDFMQRILTYNERLGFDPYMSWWMQTFILVKQRGIQKRLLKYGLVSDEDRQVWEQEKVDRRRGKGLSRRLGFEMMSLFLKRVTIGIFDRLRDILQGAPATVLFALGFVMWNVSKVISLWIL